MLFSALAGLAWSMPSLIVFRLLQGIGAGAMQPVAMTIVGDLYPAAERGKIQGYLASVWAISALVGPVAGGLITNHLSWPWIFWISVPVGALALAGYTLFLKETSHRGKGSIDVAEPVLFSLAIAALMALLERSAREAGLSPPRPKYSLLSRPSSFGRSCALQTLSCPFRYGAGVRSQPRMPPRCWR